ncbi:hypothetical protein DdX_01084 [Ditylenchus destructor]|uniref:Uncharacterized protein n=1 Tax=Ditylenchus destructor TaxID=166010 RepID=A0AAD4NG64_9BILA|nr:hypothetical protein DdX_01084 [Ditylenchus destructor]
MCSLRESPIMLDIRVNEYVLMIQLVYVIIKPRNNKKKEEVPCESTPSSRNRTFHKHLLRSVDPQAVRTEELLVST